MVSTIPSSPMTFISKVLDMFVSQQALCQSTCSTLQISFRIVMLSFYYYYYFIITFTFPYLEERFMLICRANVIVHVLLVCCEYSLSSSLWWWCCTHKSRENVFLLLLFNSYLFPPRKSIPFLRYP